jgi:anti-sigma factor RsiW
MKDVVQAQCPRTEELSALIDGELAGAARAEIASHATSCPLCGATLRELGELRDALQPLTAARVGFDLAPLLDSRLSARGTRARRPVPDRNWWQGWQWVPSGLAAGAVLMAGVYLGGLLGGGSGVVALQPAAMALFDPVPPGGLCAGMQSCYPLGK